MYEINKIITFERVKKNHHKPFDMKPILLTLITLMTLGSCRTNPSEVIGEAQPLSIYKDHLYQYSIIDALLAGVFEGELTISELKTKGDFGIGTFNSLDGEMIVIDGKVLKMRYNGEIVEVGGDEKTPLAYVKFFQADTSFVLHGPNFTFEELKERLAPYLNSNEIYAIRLKGNFDRVDARSVAPIPKPYPELADYLASGGQTSFTFKETSGTCIGFIAPEFTAQVNIPGYHLHFIDDDRENGGHVFGFQADSLSVEIDRIQGFIVDMNSHPDFRTIDLQKNRKKELEVVEQKQ